MSETTDILLNTFPTASRRSGLGQTKLWQLAGEGVLETVKVGGRTLITEESLRRLCREGAPLPEGKRKARTRKNRHIEAGYATP